jgi:hypothetical protein
MAGRWGRNFQELQRRVIDSGGRGYNAAGGGGGRGGFFGATALVGLGGFYLLSISLYNGEHSLLSLSYNVACPSRAPARRARSSVQRAN